MKEEPLTVFIDAKLKEKMLKYYSKSRKSLKLQVSEALTEYLAKKQSPNAV